VKTAEAVRTDCRHSSVSTQMLEVQPEVVVMDRLAAVRREQQGVGRFACGLGSEQRAEKLRHSQPAARVVGLAAGYPEDASVLIDIAHLAGATAATSLFLLCRTPANAEMCPAGAVMVWLMPEGGAMGEVCNSPKTITVILPHLSVSFNARSAAVSSGDSLHIAKELPL
jgi:hypothetical protein